MKNELLARAMTELDDSLIAEADERSVRLGTPQRSFVRDLCRWGSLAACVVIIIGIFVALDLGGRDVLLYGESIEDSPRTVSEYMPRAVAHLIDTMDVDVPLELEFKKETKLTVADGGMTVIDKDGNTVYEGAEYSAKGKLSVILTIPAEADECVIETDKGYNIVLTRNAESGVCYVNIQK